MADEISVEASDVSDAVDAGYVEIVEAEALDIPGFLAERGYGTSSPTPAADDDQPTTEEPSLRERLIEQGIIRPATEEPAKTEAEEGQPLPEIEEWQELRAKLEARDDELKFQKAEAERPKAERPGWRQQIRTGVQKAGSGLQKAAGGIGKGLRSASSRLRKTAPKSAAAPPATAPEPKAQTPGPKAQPQATPKAAGPSRAQKLGGALGKVFGAPQRTASGLRSVADSMRQALPKSQQSASTAEAEPQPTRGQTAKSLGQATGQLLGAPSRAVQGLRKFADNTRNALPSSRSAVPRTGAESPKAEGNPAAPSTPTPHSGGSKGGGGGGGREGLNISVPKLNLGRTATVGLIVIAVGFLTAGGMARTTQAAGGIKATPLVVVAAALFAVTTLLTLFRR